MITHPNSNYAKVALTCIIGEFHIYPVLYNNWLLLTLFIFPPKQKREEEKENELAKPVLNHIFFMIDLKFTAYSLS